jgi:Fic family protein
MDFGLEWIKEKPITLELLKEMHGILLSDAGPAKKPGEFRDVQNWIGPKEGGIRRAIFVPVPNGEPLKQALLEFERFVQDSSSIPTLLASGMAHAQFETIHPFIDGNGRIGRLMLTLLFCQRQILTRPILYLSYFFKLRRVEYYDRLQAIRDQGDWEGWLKFYLTGLSESAQEATATARQIVNMRETHRQLIATNLGKQSGKALELLEILYRKPIVTVQGIEKLIDVNYQYANRLVDSLQKVKILREMTGQRRNRRFGYGDYIDLFKTEDD